MRLILQVTSTPQPLHALHFSSTYYCSFSLRSWSIEYISRGKKAWKGEILAILLIGESENCLVSSLDEKFKFLPHFVSGVKSSLNYYFFFISF